MEIHKQDFRLVLAEWGHSMGSCWLWRTWLMKREPKADMARRQCDLQKRGRNKRGEAEEKRTRNRKFAYLNRPTNDITSGLDFGGCLPPAAQQPLMQVGSASTLRLCKVRFKWPSTMMVSCAIACGFSSFWGGKGWLDRADAGHSFAVGLSLLRVAGLGVWNRPCLGGIVCRLSIL